MVPILLRWRKPWILSAGLVDWRRRQSLDTVNRGLRQLGFSPATRRERNLPWLTPVWRYASLVVCGYRAYQTAMRTGVYRASKVEGEVCLCLAPH